MATQHLNALGRRKCAVARVSLAKGKGKIIVNKRDFKEYFKHIYLQNQIELPLKVTNNLNKFEIRINVTGGGFKGQAEASKLGIARALAKQDETLKSTLRSVSLMTRDARVVERKKFGQKKARKRFQFTKR